LAFRLLKLHAPAISLPKFLIHESLFHVLDPPLEILRLARMWNLPVRNSLLFGADIQRTRVQQRLVKTGGRLVKHARYYWLLLADSHLTRRMFGSMLRRILTLPLPAG